MTCHTINNLMKKNELYFFFSFWAEYTISLFFFLEQSLKLEYFLDVFFQKYGFYNENKIVMTKSFVSTLINKL